MNDLMKNLKEQEETWLKYADKAGVFLKKAPQGNVRVTSCRGKYDQYYYSVTDGAPANQYAGAKNLSLIRELLQKDYYRQIMRCLDPALRKIQSFIEWYDPEIINRIYNDLPESRKKLIQPIEESDEEFLKNWLDEHQPGSAGYDVNPDIISNKGEPVRSKSEKIIADKLYELGIPYVYESLLLLPGAGTVCPDFTVLNISRRQTFYYEHFGLMDDPEYAAKAFKKIVAYAEAGYWFGSGLLYTMESAHSSLNTVFLEKMIRRYLLF